MELIDKVLGVLNWPVVAGALGLIYDIWRRLSKTEKPASLARDAVALFHKVGEWVAKILSIVTKVEDLVDTVVPNKLK